MPSSPLISCSGTAILAPRLFPSVGFYAEAARYPQTIMDFDMRYDKRQKSTHRFTIADHGTLRCLTVPVSRPEGAFATGRLTWGQMLLSDHGRWWETIPIALESAYGRTPFYQYYAPKLEHLFRRPEPGALLCRLLTDADTAVRSILGLPMPLSEATGQTADLRALPDSLPGPRAYWQVQGTPFIPGLSILDLIFNQGPEAPLFLKP